LFLIALEERGAPGLSIYGASKADVRNLAQRWRLDLREGGIRVNGRRPVSFHAGIRPAGIEGRCPGGPEGHAGNGVSLGRVGTIDKIATAEVLLPSDDRSFVNGVYSFADGGMTQV